MWDILYRAILLSHKKKEVMPLAGNMDEPKDHYTSEASQRKIIIIWYHLMWSLKNGYR